MLLQATWPSGGFPSLAAAHIQPIPGTVPISRCNWCPYCCSTWAHTEQFSFQLPVHYPCWQLTRRTCASCKEHIPDANPLVLAPWRASAQADSISTADL